MVEPQPPDLYDFGIFGRVPGSQNQLLLSLETPGHLNKSMERLELVFLNTIFMDLLMLEPQHVVVVGKDRHRQIPKICLMKS